MSVILVRLILAASLLGIPALARGQVVVVRIATSLGAVIVEVDTVRAPATAANFLKYVDGGFYTNGRVHRATRDGNYVVNLPNRPLLECIQAGIDPEKKSQGFAPIPLERTTVGRTLEQRAGGCDFWGSNRTSSNG